MGNKTNAMKHFIFREQCKKSTKISQRIGYTPDSQAGGPGFKSRCRPTKVWSPNTPIPRLQVAKMCQGSLKGMVYAKAEHPGWPKKISQYSKCQTSESLWISLWRTRLWFLWKVLAAPHAVSLMMHDTISFIPCGVQFDRYCCSQLLLTSNKLWNVA